MTLYIIIGSLIALGAGAAASFFLIKNSHHKYLEEAEKKSTQILASAQNEAEQFRSNTKEQIEQSRRQLEDQEKRTKQITDRLNAAIKHLEYRSENYENEVKVGQQNLEKIQAETNSIQQATDELKQQYLPELLKILNANIDDVKDTILSELNGDLSLARELRLTKFVEDLTDKAPTIARDLMTVAIQRYEAPSSVERKSILIPVRKTETKLKLMAKNGEYLRFIEDATGVNIIFDDRRKGIIVSHYQLVKRQIARETIIRLIRDRQLNLDQVKKRFAEAEKDTERKLVNIGENVLKTLGLDYRNLPDSFKELIGRMDFRTSYGQNILKHSYEVGYFSLMLGSELGLDQEICKIGGFLGDVGKAIDQEEERPHDILTKELMEKFGFSWEEIHASWTHHDAIPIETAEALIVKGADAMSAGRPGARQETIEKYQERIRAIETIAKSYQGVNKTYAISGGRELRVVIDPKKLNDGDLQVMAEDIAGEIEGNVAYPGQIKVNVIRRTQHKKTVGTKNKA